MAFLKLVFVFSWFITNPIIPNQQAVKQAEMDQSTFCITSKEVIIPYLAPSGIIVMEDDVMRTWLDDLLDKILQIQVFTLHGYPVLNISGCQLPYCEADIQSLASRPYFVKVTTTQGTFTEYVINTP